MTAAADTGVERNAAGVTRQRNRPARFLGDVAISSAATLGLLGMIWTLMGTSRSTGIVAFALALLAAFVIYGIPVAIALYGMIRGRRGLVAGPVALLAASYL